MMGSRGNSNRAAAFLAALFLLTVLAGPGARGADQDDKDKKPEKEKKEKIEPWVEVRTAHFLVASDGGEKTARRVAGEFESLLRLFQATMPFARLGTGIPVRILVARDGQSFGRIAPEFPYDKRREREQPAGLFVAGPEKTYIGIRGNASGRFRYAEIFQNYARQILKLSYRNLPVWLAEGYSNVYGNATFDEKGIRLERPDPEDLSVLSESPLLPLDLVLHVDRTSPYYSPGNKLSVYFAESRVLVHYLISDPQIVETKAMERYITSVVGGADSLRAAGDAFGDLSQLKVRLDAYVKDVSGPAAEFPNTSGNDPGIPARTLTPAEIEARTADFLALRRRVVDAQDKLEEALMSEPSLAEAEQSLGFILLRQDDLDEAQKHFDRAAQLDPNDALNFYGQGLVAMAQSGNKDAPPQAAADFEKAVALNAEFAPSWHNLAIIYSQQDRTLQKGLDAARRAASLVPGDYSYQLHVASLLERLGDSEEARKTALQVQQTADDKATTRKAGDLVARLSRPAPSAASAPAPPGAPPKPAAGTPRLERRTEPDAKPAAVPSASPPSRAEASPTSAPVPPLFAESTKVYSMFGTIATVNCAGAPQIQITLKAANITMKLHADDLAKLEIKSEGSAAPAKGTICSSLRGRTALISYLLVSQKAWDGEMKSVEFRSFP